MYTLGVHIDSTKQLYYTDYRYHFRHPWISREISESVEAMMQVDDEDRISIRQKLASKSGFTGLSVLYRLYRLYKFNVLKDLVFDIMHTLALRVLNRHLHYYADKDYLRNQAIEKRLEMVPWTAGL